MPMYEYNCPTCDICFEELRSMRAADLPTLYSTGSTDSPRQVSRLVAKALPTFAPSRERSSTARHIDGGPITENTYQCVVCRAINDRRIARLQRRDRSTLCACRWLVNDSPRSFRAHLPPSRRAVGHAWAGDHPAGLLLMEAHHGSSLFHDRH